MCTNYFFHCKFLHFAVFILGKKTPPLGLRRHELFIRSHSCNFLINLLNISTQIQLFYLLNRVQFDLYSLELCSPSKACNKQKSECIFLWYLRV